MKKAPFYLTSLVLFIFIFFGCQNNKQQAYYFLAKEYYYAILEKGSSDKNLDAKFMFYIQKALNNNPNNFYLNSTYADYWYMKQNWMQARKYYQLAIENKDNAPQVHHRLAQIYLKKNTPNFNPKKAIDSSKKALYYTRESILSLFSKDELAQILMTLAHGYFLEGQEQEAFHTIMKALEQTEDPVLKTEIEKRLPKYLNALETKK